MSRKKQLAFLLQKDQKIIVDELTNEEAGIIFKAIYEYEETKKEPKLQKTLRIVFKQFKVKLDLYDNAYDEKCLKNKENALKRWNKNKDTNACDRIRMDTKIKENKKNKNKINKNKRERNIKEREKQVFHLSPPTLDEILSYSKQLGIDDFDYCEKFFNYYEAIGWVNGTGQQIKKWKLVFQNWIKKDKNKIQEKETVDEAGFIHRNGRRIL